MDIAGFTKAEALRICEDYDIPPQDGVSRHSEFMNDLINAVNTGFRDMIFTNDIICDDEVSMYLTPYKGDETCSICLEPLSEASDASEITCKHVFCTECISRWITEYNATCPQCRTTCEKIL
jgi:hypothetical protein